MSAATWFALAATLHAGFQVTVTALVYPALAGTPPDRWRREHARHSRTISVVVVVVYGALAVTGLLALREGPGPAGWVALVLTGVAVGVTALLAAPLHGRLANRDDALVARLLVVDRVRCVAAVAAAVTACLSLW